MFKRTRLSIYNEHTQAKFPLLGLRLKNTSGCPPDAGADHRFEGSNYAGDARILDLQPNEERLLSYAVDLGTEVNPVSSADNGRLIAIKAVKGIVTTRTRIRETKTYTIVNRNDQERTVLIEHPVRNDFKLVEHRQAGRNRRGFLSLRSEGAGGQDGELVVTEEKEISNEVSFTGLNDDSIRIFLNNPVTSPRSRRLLRMR